VWRQDSTKAADPRAKLSRRGLRWALEALVCQHLSVARVADGLAVSWNTANNAVLGEGQRVLIEDPDRLDGVRVIGVDEHVWRHTRRGDKYVTVIIDLTPVQNKTGPARLLDMVEGRSKRAFKTWLAERPRSWRDAVEVVAMEGFTGFKTATTEEVPDAVAVMDPFHVVRLAGQRPRTSAGAGSSWPPAGTGAAKPTRSTRRGGPYRPGPTCSPTSRRPGCRPCSPPTSTPRSKPPGASINA
jgi:Transposase